MNKNRKQKAVVLLSGGLDSAVTLFYAKKKGYDCHCLIVDYGQRHKREIEAARKVAKAAGVKSLLTTIALPWKGSSLLDKNKKIPARRPLSAIKSGIPSTYVPARNTIFLSHALSFAESIGARKLFIGAHVQDSSGYPDCRSEYIEAFRKVARLGTREGTRGRLDVAAPLVKRSKKEVITLGASLGVPFGLTWSCYRGGKKPCGTCDSCILRAKGFSEAGFNDPCRG